MKLDKFELDKKLSVAEMKQVKAGSVSSTSGSNHATTNLGYDTDKGSSPSDFGI
jgi:hypothetical protein